MCDNIDNWNQLFIVNPDFFTFQDLDRLRKSNKILNNVINQHCHRCKIKYDKIMKDQVTADINIIDLRCRPFLPKLACELMISNYLRLNKVFNLDLDGNTLNEDHEIYFYHNDCIIIPYLLRDTHIQIRLHEHGEEPPYMNIQSSYRLFVDADNQDDAFKSVNRSTFFEQTVAPAGIGTKFINQYIKTYTDVYDVKYNIVDQSITEPFYFKSYNDKYKYVFEIIYDMKINFKNYPHVDNLISIFAKSMCNIIKDFHSRIVVGLSPLSHINISFVNRLNNADLLWKLSKDFGLNSKSIDIASANLSNFTIEELKNLHLSEDLPIQEYEYIGDKNNNNRDPNNYIITKEELNLYIIKRMAREKK